MDKSQVPCVGPGRVFLPWKEIGGKQGPLLGLPSLWSCFLRDEEEADTDDQLPGEPGPGQCQPRLCARICCLTRVGPRKNPEPLMLDLVLNWVCCVRAEAVGQLKREGGMRPEGGKVTHRSAASSSCRGICTPIFWTRRQRHSRRNGQQTDHWEK